MPTVVVGAATVHPDDEYMRNMMTVWRRSASITVPTLVIGCTQDRTVPVENVRALHAAIAGSGYAELDCGHVVLFEQPDEFVRLVREFVGLSAVPRRP